MTAEWALRWVSNEEVLDSVRAERERQRQRWPWDDHHSVGRWLAILAGRTGKLNLAALNPEGLSPVYNKPVDCTADEAKDLYRRAVQVAAVAVAMAEQLLKAAAE